MSDKPPVPRAATNASRDFHKPKTPPAGVQEQLADPETRWDRDTTHPGMPIDELIAKRTHRISVATDEVRARLGNLEAGHKTLAVRLDAQDLAIDVVRRDAAYTAGKIDMIAANAEAQRVERAEKRAHELSRMKWRTVAKVVGAVLGVIGTAIAAWLGVR